MNELLAASVVMHVARAMADYLITECCRVNDPLARWAVTKFTRITSGCGEDYDDALQEARIALLRSVQRFDPEKSKFGHFATLNMSRSLWAWNHRRGNHGLTWLPDQRSRSKSRNACHPVPIPVSLEWDAVADRRKEGDILPEIEMLLAYVNDRERDILLSRANGDNLRNIADRYGISRERVRMIAKLAAEKIRKAVGVE